MRHDRDTTRHSAQGTTRICGVLLDIDGTLVDSNDAHARSWVDALKDAHIEARFENVRTLIGKGGDKLLPEITGIDADSERGRQIGDVRRRIFLERYAPALRPFPCVRELVRRMKDSGLKVVVASSAAKEELESLLEVAGIRDLLDSSTSSDDVDRSKPDPDIVCAARDAIGLPREQIMMVGDTPYDVEAAGRAGVAVIALRCGGWNDEALDGALAIYDDPEDLLARYDESPLAGRTDRGTAAEQGATSGGDRHPSART